MQEEQRNIFCKGSFHAIVLLVQLGSFGTLQSCFTLFAYSPLFQPDLELVLIEQHHARPWPAVSRDVLPLVQG